MNRFGGTYTPSVDDAVTAYRMHERISLQSRRLHLLGGALFLIVFGGIGIVMKFPEIIWLGVLLSPLFFLTSWMRDRAAKGHARKRTYEELSIAFTDEGISAVSQNWRNEHSWKTVKKVRIDGRGVLVYTDQEGFHFIPARAFGTPFPERELREFLVTKVQTA